MKFLMFKSILLVIFSLSLSFANASWVESYNKWNTIAIGSANVATSVHAPELISAPTLEELRVSYGSTDLRTIYYQQSEEDIKINNENIIRLLELRGNFDSSINNFLANEDAVEVLKLRQVKKIFDDLTRMKVVQNQNRYGNEDVGFCFGRALIAHIISIVRNVHPAHVAKIWVVGDMGLWGHHVATILKTSKGWYAIDNYTGLLPVDKWMKRMRQDKKRGKDLMFFLTRASRFGPANSVVYNSYDLFNKAPEELINFVSKDGRKELKRNDFYNGFFIDFYYELSKRIKRFKPYRVKENKNYVLANDTDIESRLASREERRISDDTKMSNVTGFELSRKSIYCLTNLNPEENCRFESGISNGNELAEISLGSTKNIQYLIQEKNGLRTYAKHIINPELGDISFHITQDTNGVFTKYIVELVKPIFSGNRPYIKLVKKLDNSDQAALKREIDERYAIERLQ